VLLLWLSQPTKGSFKSLLKLLELASQSQGQLLKALDIQELHLYINQAFTNQYHSNVDGI
jgi:hypothetical protein